MREFIISKLKNNYGNMIMLQEIGHNLLEKHYITDYRVYCDFKKDSATLYVLYKGKYED